MKPIPFGRARRRLVLRAQRRLRLVPGPADGWRFLRHLTFPTRGSAVRAAVDGLVVTWTLRRRGIKPLLGTVGKPRATKDPVRARQVADAIDAGLGLIPIAPTCLRRSMTLMRELDRLGLGATVHIGVRTVDRKVEAHAWVQVGDVVVNDDADRIDTYAQIAAGELDTLIPLLK